MTEPRAWSLGGEELALVRYVDPHGVARHVQLPGPSSEGRLARLREVYTPRRGPETVACLGWSHATPNAMFWENGRLRVTKDLPGWFGLRGWERDFGDGSVPAFSALPPEMDNHEHSPIRVRERHLPLSHTEAVADLLRRQLDRDPPTQIHGAEDGEHPPTLGLDLDEIHPAGTPIPLAAALREVTADLSGQPVWARLRPLDRPGRVDERLSWDPDRGDFVGELPGQPPGLYEIRVTARNVPGAGDLDAHDVVAVVEGD